MIPESIRTEEFTANLFSENEVMANIHRWFDLEWVGKHKFVWFDNQGKAEKEESVDLPAYHGIMSDDRIAGLPFPVPAYFAVGVLVGEPIDFLQSQKCSSYPSAVARSFSKMWPTLLLTSLVSAGLAWVCCRRQRRYDQPWTWVWVVTVFLFGLPGLVGYLTYRRWPPLEACPNCDATAPRDREACYSCEEEFPRPAMKGTEVFA